MDKKIILVDQDGPLADETAHLRKVLKERFPDQPDLHLPERKVFKLRDNFPEPYHDVIEEIRRSKGFYLSFPPIPEGIEAVRKMVELGHHVFICTAPLTNPDDHDYHCLGEKYRWVKKYLGEEFIERIIPAKDKTMVHGEILIDDKPEITGVKTPSWEHVVFDSSYNQHVTDKRRINWDNWREVLGL